MNILMAASEMAPFARCGSLADTLLALPSALQARGHQVSVVLPLYRSARENKDFKPKATGVKFSVQVGEATHECRIYETRLANGLQVIFLGRDEFFDRTGLYGVEGRDYQDNSARFIFFAKGVLELARRLDPSPDLIHGHDWPCGMLPVLAKYRQLPFPQVLTVHDLGFQGNFWSYDFGLTNLPAEYFAPSGVEFYGSLNFLKSGILFADRVIFPSDLFIDEIQQPGQGCGMETLLREQRGKLTGIPEGVDDATWNPVTDPLLAAPYSAQDPAPKAQCRAALLEKLGLRPDPKGPVLAMVTRLLQDKGFDILLPALDRILGGDTRLIILGRGEPPYEAGLKAAARKHEGRLHYEKDTNEDLARLIYAGADVLLAPARVEAGGTRVMQALRYGVVPVVRASGGLRQLVEDFEPATGAGNGFVFYDFTPDALVDAVRRAEEIFLNPTAWRPIMQRGMAHDCSWGAAAERHERLYRHLLER
jgi:starch synthase